MVSFEIFVKAMPPSLSELKVLPSFCFAFKIPDNMAASNKYVESIYKTQKSRTKVLPSATTNEYYFSQLYGWKVTIYRTQLCSVNNYLYKKR